MSILLSSLGGILLYIITALVIGYMGYGSLYNELILGSLTDNFKVIFLLILAYIPGFGTGVISAFTSGGFRKSIRTILISSFIVMILGTLIVVLLDFLILNNSVVMYGVWNSMSFPLFIASSFIGSIVGYLILLGYLLSNRI